MRDLWSISGNEGMTLCVISCVILCVIFRDFAGLSETEADMRGIGGKWIFFQSKTKSWFLVKMNSPCCSGFVLQSWDKSAFLLFKAYWVLCHCSFNKGLRVNLSPYFC